MSLPQPIPSDRRDPDRALDPMERQVLDRLRGGPAPVERLPVRWPLIRMHLPVVLERLAGAGLIRVEGTAGGDVARLTEPGHAALQPSAQPSAGSSRPSTPFSLSVRK